MARESKKDSTSTTSDISDKGKFSFNKSFHIWWPVLLIIIVFGIAGATKYLWPNSTIYSLMIDLVKAISLLLVVFYVIYTRLLAIETKKMATTSMALFYSEKGSVRSELHQGDCSFSNLCEQVQELTKKIHVEEKGFTEEEFGESIKQKSIPSIDIEINNLTGRRIQVTKIEYNIRHTGSDQKHASVINIEKDSKIDPWKDMILHLCAAPEGEVEIDNVSVIYLDNRNIQNKIGVENSLKIERIRKPKNTEDDS